MHILLIRDVVGTRVTPKGWAYHYVENASRKGLGALDVHREVFSHWKGQESAKCIEQQS